jgi:2-methylisocitrate lyase-like PEP mutase family enzyme
MADRARAPRTRRDPEDGMSEMAERFHALHEGPEMLVLPNAWDAASARIVERAGARAIATTSSGIAQSLGFRDGNVLARDLAVEVVARIVRAVRIPVSADIEEGYGATPDDVADTVEAIVAAGAVGINLEDGAKDAAILADKIRAIRRRFDRSRLFINARPDLFLRGAENPLAGTLERAKLYRDAGADGIFVPRAKPDDIAKLCAEIPLPVNILALPGTAPPAELAKLGVRRLSVGGGLMHAALGATERWARSLLQDGRYDFLEVAISPAEANKLFEHEARRND